MTPSRPTPPPSPAAAASVPALGSQPAVVLIDEGHGWPADLVDELHEQGYAVARLFSFELVPVLVSTHKIQAVLVEFHRLRPGDLAALRQSRQNAPETAIVLVSPTNSDPILAQALQWGATALLAWPGASDALTAALTSSGSLAKSAETDREPVAAVVSIARERKQTQ